MRRLWQSFLKLLPLVIILALIPFLTEWEENQRQSAASPSVVPEDLPESDLRITNGRFTETQNGRLIWQLEANSAQLYERKQYAKLETVKAFSIQKDGNKIHIKGEKGNIWLKSKDLELNNNVEVTYDNGLILTTQSLYWKNFQEEITTREWVEVKWKNVRLTAKGMDMFNSLNKIVMKDQVTTYFN